jgi:hypothetical protein
MSKKPRNTDAIKDDSKHAAPGVQVVRNPKQENFTYSEGAVQAAKKRRLETIGKENDKK